MAHQHYARRSLFLAITVLLLVVASSITVQPLHAAWPSQPEPQATSGPSNGDFKLYLSAPRAQGTGLTGRSAARAAIAGGSGDPLALAVGDFNQDGVQDLVAGYGIGSAGALVIHCGNLDAFAPQSDASFQAIGRGEFPDPFLPDALTIDVPVRPDFVAVGDFDGDGNADIVFAARSVPALYILAGDSKGKFASPKIVNLDGVVTALAAIPYHQGRFSSIFVGTTGPGGSVLSVVTGSDMGLTPVARVALAGPLTSIAFGDLFRDGGHDAALVADGQLFLLRGGDLNPPSRHTLALRSVNVPGVAAGVVVGRFIFDRDSREQVAILTTSGDVHIIAQEMLDQRPWTLEEVRARRQAVIEQRPFPVLPVDPTAGWKVAESHYVVAASGAAVALKGNVSDQGFEDVMVVDGSDQLHVVAHGTPEIGNPDALPKNGLRSSMQMGGVGGTVAALAMRVNIDGRPGVVMLTQGASAPVILMPLPDPTFFVNRTDDPVPTSPIANACTNVSNADTSVSCSLREAILKANATAGTDTVMVGAGTFTLSLARVSNDCTGNHGALSVNDSLNIVGAGQNTTIIQAGTTNANGVDMVMNVNEDLGTANCPITNATASISNLTIKFGRNGGSVANFDGDGGGMEFDTGSSGTANLALTNVTFDSNATMDGNGAGIAIFNSVSPSTGQPTITNSIFQNGSAAEVAVNAAGSGGGIWVADLARMSMSNSQVINNNANQINGTGRGVGGGIFIFSAGSGSRQTVLHNVTISGNRASGDGGGVWDTANLLIDSTGGPTVISGNTAGGNGGGIHYHAVSPDVMTLTKVAITGNTATGNGGGIDTGEPSLAHAFTMSFSRLAGNTAAAGSNLNNNHSTATVTNSWWGTNSPAGTITNVNGGTTSFDPFIVLTHQGSPVKIRINQSSTLTGDMSSDNHGNAVGLANLDRILGLPITFDNFDNPLLGAIPQAQPEVLNASAQATATFNAGGTSGRATPNATVDQAVAPANVSLISAATESGTTVTITTVGAHGFTAGETVVISGVGVGSYNGTFIITGTPTATTFTYTNPTPGLGVSSGGTAKVGIVILEPPSITKSFGAANVAINATTTVNFSIDNPNVVAINGSFTDTLPIGLQVAATPGVSSTCGGAVTAVAGSSSISFSNNLTPVGVCSISVNITGTVDNNYTNSVQILSSDAGDGNTSTAGLTVINPPHMAKAFGATTIPLNGATSLTLTLDSNSNQNLTITGAGFTDNLPPGLVVASNPNLSTTCGGTATAVGGSSSVSLSSSSLAPNTTCTVSVTVQGIMSGQLNNSVQANSSNAGTGNTASASLVVVAPPTISKAFGAASIPLNGSTALTFTINNPNLTAAGDLTGVTFSDTLPSASGIVVVAATPTVSNTCNGTVTATAGSGVITLTGGTVTHNVSCTLSVQVTGTAAGDALNTTGAISSTEGGTGTISNTATLKIVAPPTISKAFGATSVLPNGSTTLTFAVTNPPVNTTALNGVAFSDTLSNGLQVASTPGVTNSCGGTVTATANSTSISLSGGSIATPGNVCTIVVNVTGTQAGTVSNTTAAVSATNGGTGTTSNAATLNVVAPPTISKAFGATSILLNSSTTLTFTITNPPANITALNGVAFSDTLTNGLQVASTPAVTNSCGGTVTATAGSTSISLSGGSIATPGNACTVVVNMSATQAGSVPNITSPVSSTNGGTGIASNTATINVVAPPTISKAFGAVSIPLNGSTSLNFTIQNQNTTTALTGVGFSDTLPAGLVISAPNGLTGSCGGGTVTATAGTNVISLTGASLAASTSCTFSVNVTGSAAGLQTNTTGNVTSTEGSTGGTASASLKVEAPPSIAKVFNPTAVALNTTTALTFTITNPAANLDPLTGVAFTDTLPTGLTVANASATLCGGTLTTTSPTGMALSGATIAVNSQCQFSVTVTGAASGQYTNTTGNVTSTNGGTGNTASANLTVATPPAITKSFGAASIPLSGTTSLTFSITNANSNVALTGVAFTDTLPVGLVVANTPNLSNTCGGTAVAVGGSSSVSLSGASEVASGSCMVSVNVQGTTAGVMNNSVSVSSTNAGTGIPSNATLTVVAPPAISKAFGTLLIPLNGSTSLSFSISNANTTTALTGVGFNDTLPAGLVLSTPNGFTGSCGAGTITATANTNVISLNGATLAVSSSCTFAVNVTGVTGGHKLNTTTTVTSTNSGSGNQATASIDVLAPDLTITKTHTGTFSRGQTGATFTITVSNVGFGPTVGTVTVTDALPNVANTFLPTAMSGTGWACTLATLACTRNDALASGTSYPDITLAVNIPTNIQANVTNVATISGGGDVNSNNNTATDPTHIGAPVQVIPSQNVFNVQDGGTGSVDFTVDSSAGVGTLTFSCSGLPAKATCNFNPATTNQLTTTVTMTVSASSGTASSRPFVPWQKIMPIYAVVLFPLAGLVHIGTRGKKRRKKILQLTLLSFVLLLAMGLFGCGGHADFNGTPPGSYPITVTAQSATASGSASITLNVTGAAH